MASPLVASVRAALTEAADASRAPGMQAYMKSAMPYLGVSAVPLRQICKALFKNLAWPTDEAWQRDVLALWCAARFREERYAAIELTGVKAARPFHTLAALPLYEEMIVSGAWWDFVDAIATQRLWVILQNEGQPMKQAMLGWSTDPDMWKRRSAILCQLKAKAGTDLDMLYACIEPSIDSREFFLRKAIGWALREYAKTDADEVRRYVSRNTARLSGLSLREALKNVGAG
ncbi:MAG TPA: DNA alkylation repair protein [Croceibacterium sp.]